VIERTVVKEALVRRHRRTPSVSQPPFTDANRAADSEVGLTSGSPPDDGGREVPPADLCLPCAALHAQDSRMGTVYARGLTSSSVWDGTSAEGLEQRLQTAESVRQIRLLRLEGRLGLG
jgi:hypothetical protein